MKYLNFTWFVGKHLRVKNDLRVRTNYINKQDSVGRFSHRFDESTSKSFSLKTKLAGHWAAIHCIFQSFLPASPRPFSSSLDFFFLLFYLYPTSIYFINVQLFFFLHADTFEGSSSALLYGYVCEWRTSKVGSPLPVDFVFVRPHRPMIGRCLSNHFCMVGTRFLACWFGFYRSSELCWGGKGAKNCLKITFWSLLENYVYARSGRSKRCMRGIVQLPVEYQ